MSVCPKCKGLASEEHLKKNEDKCFLCLVKEKPTNPAKSGKQSESAVKK